MAGDEHQRRPRCRQVATVLKVEGLLLTNIMGVLNALLLAIPVEQACVTKIRSH